MRFILQTIWFDTGDGDDAILDSFGMPVYELDPPLFFDTEEGLLDEIQQGVPNDHDFVVWEICQDGTFKREYDDESKVLRPR